VDGTGANSSARPLAHGIAAKLSVTPNGYSDERYRTTEFAGSWKQPPSRESAEWRSALRLSPAGSDVRWLLNL